jgi:glycosyltransferase involved in cell wall biosynthesis
VRILIISYSYAPVINPRAFRWTALAEFWARQGHEIDVITVWSPGRERSESRNGVTVHRVGGAVSGSLRALIKRAGPDTDVTAEKFSISISSINRSSAGKFARGLKWLHDHTWKRIYWPDFACIWYFAATRKMKALLGRKPYDAMITVSLPFTDHLIGKGARRVQPDLAWLVDIGDPFCFLDMTPHNNRRLYRRLNERVERSVFMAADAVSVTTEKTRDHYVRLFPEAKGKMHVMGPLLPAITESRARQVFPADGVTRLVFVGTLYREIRNPTPVLAFFNELTRKAPDRPMELHFFGDIHDCEPCFAAHRELLGRRVFLHGVVDRETALSAMQQATTLINIGNNTSYQLPSKVLEYAASGRPLINVVQDSSDSSVEVLRSHPACLTLFGHSQSVEQHAAAVARFIQQTRHGDYSARLGWLKAFETPSIAGQYMALMQAGRQRRTH